MHALNLNFALPFHSLSTFTIFYSFLFLVSCDKTDITEPLSDRLTRVNATEHMVDLGVLMENIEGIEVEITTRSAGYDALAKGHGTIPGGEYAGHHFNVTINACYSAIGTNTLTTGEAIIKIRSQKFESIEICDSGFESFCNGEGSLWNFGTHWEFTMYGQIEHLSAATPHNHLFAGFGSTAGTMNFNIANQTGTVTETPGGPNHDPDIGLITSIPARPVRVR